MVKRLPTIWETRLQSMGQEDLLEKEMATHFNILAWKNPTDGETWQATVHGVTKSRTRLSDFTWANYLTSQPFSENSCDNGSLTVQHKKDYSV